MKHIFKDEIPPLNKYVIIEHNRGSWHDKDDQENVNKVIAKYTKRGIGKNGLVYYFKPFGPDEFREESVVFWWDLP